MDILLKSIPQEGLRRAMTEEYDTFDLERDGKYAPKPGLKKRRFSAREALMSYLGIPIREMKKDELRPVTTPKKTRKVEKERKRRRRAKEAAQ